MSSFENNPENTGIFEIEEAKKLLLAMANTKDGTCELGQLYIGGGFSLKCGYTYLAERVTGRDEAKWREAINKLEGAGLIAERGTKGVIFGLTNAGFVLADTLNANDNE
jgi:hypothetical protein